MPSDSAAAAIARPISLTASPRSWRPFESRNADSTGIRISATTLLATSSWPDKGGQEHPAIEVVRADGRDERADVGGLLRGLERRGAADGVRDRLVGLELAEGPEGLGAVEVVHAGGDVGGALGGQRDGLAGSGSRPRRSARRPPRGPRPPPRMLRLTGPRCRPSPSPWCAPCLMFPAIVARMRRPVDRQSCVISAPEANREHTARPRRRPTHRRRSPSAARVDVHLRARPPRRDPAPRRARPRRRRGPTTAATSGAGSTRPVANRSRAPGRPGEALRIPIAVTSLNTTCRLSTRLGCPDSPIQTTRRPGSTRSIARAGSWAAFDASTTRVERPGRAASRRSTRARTRATARTAPTARDAPGGARPTPRGARHQRHQQPDRARSEHQQPLARPDRGRLQRPPGVAAGLDQRPAACRRRRRAGRGGTSPAPRAARPARRTSRCRMPTSNRSAHRCCRPLAAAVAATAAEHRVAGDAPPDPRLVDVRAPPTGRCRTTRARSGAGTPPRPCGGRPSRP